MDADPLAGAPSWSGPAERLDDTHDGGTPKPAAA